MILGMMAGSLYAIGMGPTTLDIPQTPLNTDNFHIAAAILGASLVLGLQMIKEAESKDRGAG